MEHVRTHTLQEFCAWASAFARARSVQGKGATVVGLYGQLGAGKTTFTQAAARALGVCERVTSPTFVIQKTYPLYEQPFTHLVHIDAYRLGGAHDLGPLLFEETLRDKKALVFIEWADRIQDTLPPQTHHIKLTCVGESGRMIEHENSTYEKENTAKK